MPPCVLGMRGGGNRCGFRQRLWGFVFDCTLKSMPALCTLCCVSTVDFHFLSFHCTPVHACVSVRFHIRPSRGQLCCCLFLLKELSTKPQTSANLKREKQGKREEQRLTASGVQLQASCTLAHNDKHAHTNTHARTQTQTNKHTDTQTHTQTQSHATSQC